jgi:hypothetical protein
MDVTAPSPVRQPPPSQPPPPQSSPSPQSPPVSRLFAVPIFALANGEPWSPPGGTMRIGPPPAPALSASGVASGTRSMSGAVPVESKKRRGWKRKSELVTLQESLPPKQARTDTAVTVHSAAATTGNAMEVVALPASSQPPQYNGSVEIGARCRGSTTRCSATVSRMAL